MTALLGVSLLAPPGGLDEFVRAHPTGENPAVSAESPRRAPAGGPGGDLRRTPRLARLALAALAPLTPRPGDSGQALILATAYGSAAATFDFLDSVLNDGPTLASPTAFAYSVANMAAALVGRHLGLTGPTLTVTNFPLTPAVEAAAALLAARRVETVLLGTTAELSPTLDEVERRAGRPVSTPVEGAVFFRLGRAAEMAGAPRLVWTGAAGAEEPPGLEAAPGCGPLGRGPLASAFRLALAYSRPAAGGERIGFPGEKFELIGGAYDRPR
jgi:hypothetical protein